MCNSSLRLSTDGAERVRGSGCRLPYAEGGLAHQLQRLKYSIRHTATKEGECTSSSKVCRAATARRQNSPSPPSARSSGRQCSHQRRGHGRAADCRVVPDVPRHRRPEEVWWPSSSFGQLWSWHRGKLHVRASERGELHVHPPDAHTQRNTESTLGTDSVSNFLLKMAS